MLDCFRGHGCLSLRLLERRVTPSQNGWQAQKRQVRRRRLEQERIPPGKGRTGTRIAMSWDQPDFRYATRGVPINERLRSANGPTDMV